MSAPTSGSADGSPAFGWYPDPSIPSYIRFWSGAAWVPGTSRPAPAEGEPMPAPPAGVAPVAAPALAAPLPPVPQPASPAPRETARQADRQADRQVDTAQSAGPLPEETGPMFLDEEPALRDARAEAAGRNDGGGRDDGAGRNDPGADTRGPSDSRDPRDSHDPRDPRAGLSGAPGAALPAARDPRLPGAATDPATDASTAPESRPGAARGGDARPARGDGTLTIRAKRPGPGPAPTAVKPGGTMQLRPPARPQPDPDLSPAPQVWPDARAAEAATPAPAAAPAERERPAQRRPVLPATTVTPQPRPRHDESRPERPAPTRQEQRQEERREQRQEERPERPAPVGWAQQVQQLAQAHPGDAMGWKPPKDDPFLRMSQTQGRPAALGRRLAARLVDTAVLAGAVGAAAVPLWGKSVDHIDEKVRQAKQSGQTVTVWLLDGTTGTYLGIVLGVLLLFGVLYEALPTAAWGRTLGKKLCGVRVLDIESHDTVSFGAALRRWLVYGVLGVLVVGVVNVLWCLVDRPWRQCWHDKAARTFVASAGD
ncbi:RDD family protein [Streptomyces syringium]|uniref:RDD family protein n=1 Tax=Streptomyces syringium TaxID=76729 RepID=UPI001AE64D72|nr:RDD family protein [Streptomyces syringium]